MTGEGCGCVQGGEWVSVGVWVCQEGVGVSGGVGVGGGVWVCQAREVGVSGEGHVALCLLAGCTECLCSYQIR